jgi:molybdopterin-binding protein
VAGCPHFFGILIVYPIFVAIVSKSPTGKLIKKIKMKLSAKNQLKGTVVSIEEGLITAKVTLDLGNGNIVTAIISKDSIKDLGLKVSDTAYAIIKSTEVIIGID